MPYSIIQPGMLDGLDEDCTFSIPAINDNMRKMDVLQSSIAAFPALAYFRPGDVVLAYPSAAHARWMAWAGPGPAIFYHSGFGVIGVAVSHTSSEGVVRVQMVGQAMARAAAATSTAYIGRYLTITGDIYNGPLQSNRVVGKITGVIDARHYEVLLHAKPQDVTGFMHGPGVSRMSSSDLPFSTGDQGIVFDVKRAYGHWYDNAQGGGQDNCFVANGFNTLLKYINNPEGQTAGSDKFVMEMDREFISGSAKIDTYNHSAKDHPFNAPVADIRTEVQGNKLTLILRSGQTRNWHFMYEFDATIQVAGWWRL